MAENSDFIKVRGARQHNLKNVDLDIPKNKMVAFTGVSGSGKSSMAFDTIYAEGQRRYVESLSTYARQFLGVMEKPQVDHIEGLSPSISIDQKTTSRNPRSTVGTVTEIYDYLRLLYARVGHPHCPICGREISSQSAEQIVQNIFTLLEDAVKQRAQVRLLIFAPVVLDKKGEFIELFSNLSSKGYRQVRIDGVIKDLDEDFVLIKTNKHKIDALVDRLSVDKKLLRDEVKRRNLESRLTDSIEQALALADGLVIASEVKDITFELNKAPKEMVDHLFSERFACPNDNIQLPEIEPRTFSFNSPHGACPTCAGLGRILKVDEDLLFAPEISITEGAILPFANMFDHDTWYSRLILAVCHKNGIDPRKKVGDLESDKVETLLNGTDDKEYKVEGANRFGRLTYIYETFPGVIAELDKRYKNTSSDWVRSEIEKYMRETVCPECGGARLKKESLGITVDAKSISQTTSLSITNALTWVGELTKILSSKEVEIGALIINELIKRLNFLVSVGLNYLTLDRSAGTLSGGEAQRIRLASQIGSGLTGVLYVLDEPTIGLHQKDNERLINTLKNLRDLGNTVVVVEHDTEVVKSCDYLIDFGPGAGKFGGAVIATGTLKEIGDNPKSITGKYLSGKKKIKVESAQIKLPEKPNYLEISGCTHNNLADISVKVPLGKLVVFTGVSGSGKSSLLVETVYPALASKLFPLFKGPVGEHKNLTGWEELDKVILIDQSPIGRTPRSNPATYTKLFDYVRDIFTSTKEAKTAGYKKGRFSFNVKGGRCEACEGQGQIKIEMQFMSDIWVTCEVCQGRRFNSQTLEIEYKGKNISQVLGMTIDEAYDFFHSHPNVTRRLETLKDVGLGYMELGQSAITLSGGEAQRVKLASELSKKATGNTFYVLDEPTTGLHFADLEKLLRVLRLLVDKGNTVVLIEHNTDVIKNADWVIDLGPEGGAAGGRIVAKGTPKDIKNAPKSYTGMYL